MIIKELFFFLASHIKKTAVVGTKLFGENCCGFPLWWWLQNNCPALYQSSASFEFIGSNSLSQETENLLWKPGFMIRHDRVIGRSQWGVKCKLKRNSGFSELTYMLPQERHFCCCSVGLWGRMAAPLKICLCGQVLSLLKQVGCTSLGLLMKWIWQIF